MFFIKPCHYDQFMKTMEANGFDESLPESYLLDCIELMKELITGDMSAVIVDKLLNSPNLETFSFMEEV